MMLSEARFRRKLDPILKNIIKNQYPTELLFKDLNHFDTLNPVIGNLSREVDIGKKTGLSKFLPRLLMLMIWNYVLGLISFVREMSFLMEAMIITTTITHLSLHLLHLSLPSLRMFFHCSLFNHQI